MDGGILKILTRKIIPCWFFRSLESTQRINSGYNKTKRR